MKCETCNEKDAVILSVANKEGERKPVCGGCYITLEKENDSKRTPTID